MPSRQTSKRPSSTRPKRNDQGSIPSEDQNEIEARMTPLSGSTPRSEVPNTRKRKRQKDHNKAAATKASAEKNKKKHRQKKKPRVKDKIFLYDANAVEKPTLADFSNGYGSLLPRNYRTLWGELVQPSADNQMENETLEPQEILTAPPPSVPAHDDDEPQLSPVEDDTNRKTKRKTKKKKIVNPRIARRANSERTHHKSAEFIRSGDESDDEPMDQPEQAPETQEAFKREPPTFMNIPVEIRDRIYRQLLLVNKPISVHGSWRLVYKRNKLDLPTGILRACKQVHAEASRVLYGENTFLYRLRDPTASVRDIERLAQDDTEAPEDDEGDSDSEWEGGKRAASTTRRSSRRSSSRVSKSEWDINIDKYSHLFRSIVVEAEQNRYSEETQESMAKAIYVFAEGQPLAATCSKTRSKRGKHQQQQQQPPLQKRKKKQKFNIRTLAIRVTPLWNPTGGNDGKGAFTFIDFFKPDSPVLTAVKAVESQFLRVDLLTHYMGRSSSLAPAPAESGACRLTMDRRYLNIYNEQANDQGKGFSDWWAKDEVMQTRRQQLAQQCMKAMDMLAVHVERECADRDFHERTTEDWVEGGGVRERLLWEYLEDDEDGF